MNVHDDLLQQAASAAILDETPVEEVVNQLNDTEGDLTAVEGELTGLSRTAVETATIVESLESFISTTFEHFSAESWNPKVARQFETGMANILGAKGIALPTAVFCASFEDANTTETNEENHDKSKEKSGNFLSRVWQAFIEAISNWAKTVRNWFVMLGKSADAISLAGKTLTAKCSGLTDATNPGQVGGGYLKYLGDGGNPDAVLQSLSSTALVSVGDWLKMMGTGAAAIKKAVQSGQELSDSSDVSTPLDKFNKDWCGVSETVVTSAHIDTGTAKGTLRYLSNLKVEVKKVAGEKPKDQKTLSVAEIRSLATKLGTVSSTMKQIESVLSKSLDEIDQIVKLVKEKAKDKDGASTKLSSKDISAMSKILTNTSLYPQKVAVVLGTIGKMAFSHGKACVAAHEAGGGKKEKAEEKEE